MAASPAARTAWSSATSRPKRGSAGPSPCCSDGDRVTIDADAKKLSVALDESELAHRKAGWQAPEPRVERGVLAKYARCVRSASEGAVTS